MYAGFYISLESSFPNFVKSNESVQQYILKSVEMLSKVMKHDETWSKHDYVHLCFHVRIETSIGFGVRCAMYWGIAEI